MSSNMLPTSILTIGFNLPCLIYYRFDHEFVAKGFLFKKGAMKIKVTKICRVSILSHKLNVSDSNFVLIRYFTLARKLFCKEPNFDLYQVGNR